MYPKRWSVISGMSGRIRPEYAFTNLLNSTSGKNDGIWLKILLNLFMYPFGLGFNFSMHISITQSGVFLNLFWAGMIPYNIFRLKKLIFSGSRF